MINNFNNLILHNGDQTSHFDLKRFTCTNYADRSAGLGWASVASMQKKWMEMDVLIKQYDFLKVKT